MSYDAFISNKLPSMYTVGEQKHFCHLERSYLLLLCGIGYNVVKW